MPAFRRSTCPIIIGFIAGSIFSIASMAIGKSGAVSIAASNQPYFVSLSEIKQNFVFADSFSGSYTRSVRMSDGSTRRITLRPVTKNGVQLVELTDSSPTAVTQSFMGPNGTTTDGKLVIDVKSRADLLAQMKLAHERRL
jgi:hypothetical protein